MKYNYGVLLFIILICIIIFIYLIHYQSVLHFMEYFEGDASNEKFKYGVYPTDFKVPTGTTNKGFFQGIDKLLVSTNNFTRPLYRKDRSMKEFEDIVYLGNPL